MSALTSTDVLRPSGLKGALTARAMALSPKIFALLRRICPLPRFGSFYLATRYDDVREVFATDLAFSAPYKEQLDVITGGEPFFLGMDDTPAYHAQIDAMRRVIRPEDLPRLGEAAEAQAETIVSASGRQVEVVDQLVRRVTFDLLTDYFGVPEPEVGELRVWATRLFEFQFVDKGPALRGEVDEIAPVFRAHIDRIIQKRRAEPSSRDDVLGRCLALQETGTPGYSDVEIRTALLCMIVGGPPQPCMVVPQAIEQLLRRPAALAGAQAAAGADDDELLRDYLFEAMRFDPLAPGLPRIATSDHMLAKGTPRERVIPKGATILAAFASAMMDERRVRDPSRFDHRRPPSDYIHFGHGLHQCFGRHINRAILHRMVKPLLRQPNLRRARGAAGRLRKNGAFAERLVVEFG